MKSLFLPRLALLACAFSIAGMTTILAQDDSSSSAPPSRHHHHGVLTKEEWQELKKDKEQVLSSNPDLKTEGQTLHQQLRAHMKKVEAAIVQADPNAAPIIAKLKAAHHRHHHQADSDSNSDSSSDNGDSNS